MKNNSENSQFDGILFFLRKKSKFFFKDYLYKLNAHTLVTYLVDLLNEDNTRSIINKRFDIILKRFANESQNANACINSFLEQLKRKPGGKEIIKNNYKTIINTANKNNLFELAQIMKGISEEIDALLEQQLAGNHLEVAKSILRKAIDEDVPNKTKLAEDYALTLSIMIQELLKSENCRWIDIDYITSGGYSKVYQIKDKILKIGSLRAKYNIPNHTRILQPLTRINLIDENNYNNRFACIEIMDRVEPVKINESNESIVEELYQLYAELRDAGIIWTDVTMSNVGRLIRPNIPNLNGENIDVVPSAVGFYDNQKGKPQSIGSLVILDTDFIFPANSNNIIFPESIIAFKFAKRYAEENERNASSTPERNASSTSEKNASSTPEKTERNALTQKEGDER